MTTAGPRPLLQRTAPRSPPRSEREEPARRPTASCGPQLFGTPRSCRCQGNNSQRPARRHSQRRGGSGQTATAKRLTAGRLPVARQAPHLVRRSILVDTPPWPPTAPCDDDWTGLESCQGGWTSPSVRDEGAVRRAPPGAGPAKEEAIQLARRWLGFLVACWSGSGSAGPSRRRRLIAITGGLPEGTSVLSGLSLWPPGTQCRYSLPDGSMVDRTAAWGATEWALNVAVDLIVGLVLQVARRLRRTGASDPAP